MLTKLIARFDSSSSSTFVVREAAHGEEFQLEEEDENE